MIVVEVLGRRGEVVQQVRLAALPATIGRAWSSDVVVNDPMVDAQHVRISADEWGVHLEDLGSVNGMHVDATRHHVPRVTLSGVTSIRLGRTWLRLTRTDQPVPAAIPDRAPSGRLVTLLASTPAMVAVFAIGLVLATLNAWLSSYTANPAAKIPGEIVLLAAAVAAWAGVWAVIGRVRTHQFQFLQHHTVIWLAMIAGLLLGVVSEWFEFLVPASAVAGTVFVILASAIAILTISGHLAMVGAARRGRRFALASGIVGGVLLLVALSTTAPDSEFSTSHVIVEAALKPVPERFIPAESVDDFVKDTDEVKKTLDENAKD